ncbi:MAG: hypothetical protein K0Q49_650 [Haloplasmataceae bacterium]|jgi:hypothetical protein|nr:hypothetical protein [Haloplasmataceae bacterium]
MPNYENPYILSVKQYIEQNTPLNFMLNKISYDEIYEVLYEFNLKDHEKQVVIACYTLLYAAINYHLMIRENPQHKSYCILVGDFISSYVLEILYANKLFKLKHVFITNSKKIFMNIINNRYEDTLLADINNYYKGS